MESRNEGVLNKIIQIVGLASILFSGSPLEPQCTQRESDEYGHQQHGALAAARRRVVDLSETENGSMNRESANSRLT